VPALPTVRARALMALGLGWLPLLLLVMLAPGPDRAGDLRLFFSDVGAHARFAFAVPILLVAHVETARRLGAVARHFAMSGLLPPDAVDRLRVELAYARAAVRAPWAEVLVLVLAYAVVLWFFASGISTHGLAGWAMLGQGQLSAAGWWHMLVSLPLLLTLLMGWLWRILLWTRLLHKVARMDLRWGSAASPRGASPMSSCTEPLRR
jgi:hypothetical protein